MRRWLRLLLWTQGGGQKLQQGSIGLNKNFLAVGAAHGLSEEEASSWSLGLGPQITTAGCCMGVSEPQSEGTVYVGAMWSV